MWSDDLHPEVFYAAKRYQKGDWGMEGEVEGLLSTIADVAWIDDLWVKDNHDQDIRFCETEQGVNFLHDALLLRQTRLEEAPQDERFPQCQYEESIDYVVRQFVLNIEQLLADKYKELDEDPFPPVDTLLFIRQYGRDIGFRASEIKRIARAIKAKETEVRFKEDEVALPENNDDARTAIRLNSELSELRATGDATLHAEYDRVSVRS